jgi:para-nitrobenzyl esterase
VVTIASGSLEGSSWGEAGGVFLGIPFAAPPVGDLRWKEPQPVIPWKGLRQAKNYASSAMQVLTKDGFLPWTPEFCVQNEVSEDCLYLNVWSPSLKADAKLPVIVFIHGGAFTGGSGEVPLYEGTRLAQKGVVVVTINYRLGIFGFFAHPGLTAESPRGASGNYGLMDQIAALRWVRENIAAFGGDRDRVTIWGQSAGSFSVKALLFSDEARGLFQRAFCASGIGVFSRDIDSLASAEAEGARVAAAHGAEGLGALRALPAEELLKWDYKYRHPIADGWVLRKSFAELAEEGAGSAVPVMTGYTGHDGMLSIPQIDSMTAWNAYAERLFGAMSGEFCRLYPAETPDTARRAALESARDRERVLMALFAEQWAARRQLPVYAYFFTRAVPWPEHPEYGAFHSGELPYFFDNQKILVRPWEAVDRELAATASAYLVNFAATGDPNGGVLPLWSGAASGPSRIQELGERVGPMAVADEAKESFWRRVLTSDLAGNMPFL